MDIPEDLQTLKRPALQKLCKAYNIKANKKNASMIEALLVVREKLTRESVVKTSPMNEMNGSPMRKRASHKTRKTRRRARNVNKRESSKESSNETIHLEQQFDMSKDKETSFDKEEVTSISKGCDNEEQIEEATGNTEDGEPRVQNVSDEQRDEELLTHSSKNTADVCSPENVLVSTRTDVVSIDQDSREDGETVQDPTMNNAGPCPVEISEDSTSVSQDTHQTLLPREGLACIPGNLHVDDSVAEKTETCNMKPTKLEESLTNPRPNFKTETENNLTVTPPRSHYDATPPSSSVTQEDEHKPQMLMEDEQGGDTNSSGDKLNTTFTIESPEKQVSDPLAAMNESLTVVGSRNSTPLQGSWMCRDTTFTKDTDHISFCTTPPTTASLIKSAVIGKDFPLVQCMKKDEKENVGSQHEEIMAILNSRVETIMSDPNYVPEIGSTSEISKIPVKKSNVTGKFNKLHNKQFNQMESIDQTFEKRKRKLDTTGDGPSLLHSSKRLKVQTTDPESRPPVKAARKTITKSTIDRLSTPKHQAHKSFTQKKDSALKSKAK